MACNKFSYLYSSYQCIYCFLIQLRIPFPWVQIAGDINPTGPKYSGRTFRFNGNGIPVQPPKHVGDVDASTEFVNDDGRLITVSTPKFGPGIFGIRVQSSFMPGTSGFSGPSSSPIDKHFPFLGAGGQVIRGDLFEGPIVLNVGRCVDIFKVTAFGCVADFVPVTRIVTFK